MNYSVMCVCTVGYFIDWHVVFNRLLMAFVFYVVCVNEYVFRVLIKLNVIYLMFQIFYKCRPYSVVNKLTTNVTCIFTRNIMAANTLHCNNNNNESSYNLRSCNGGFSCYKSYEIIKYLCLL